MPKLGRKNVWSAACGALVFLLLVVATSASAMSSAERDRLVREATTFSESILGSALWPELRGADVRAPMSGERYDEVAELVAQRITAGGPVRSVRIWSPDGTIVFSDDEKLVGRRNEQMRPALLAALGDGPRSDVVKDDLRTLMPITFGLDNETAAVVEFDRPYAPIAAEAGSPWRLLMLLSIAGAVLAALLLARSIRTSGLGRAIGFARSEGEPGDETGADLRAEAGARKRAETALAAAEERAKQLQREMDAARTELAQAEHRLEEEQGTRRELERVREELERAGTRASEGESQREAMRRELDSVRTQLATTQADMRSARDEIERLVTASQAPDGPAADDELVSARAELEAARTELTAAQALATELASVQAQLTAAKEHARSLALRSEEAEAAAATAESARQSVDEELAAVRAELTHLRSRLDAASGSAPPEVEEVRNPLARLREMLGEEPSPATNGDVREDGNELEPSPNGSTNGSGKGSRKTSLGLPT